VAESTRARDQILGCFLTVESSIQNDIAYSKIEKTTLAKALPHHPVSAGFMRCVANCIAYTLQLTWKSTK